jgi:hypothetical protein
MILITLTLEQLDLVPASSGTSTSSSTKSLHLYHHSASSGTNIAPITSCTSLAPSRYYLCAGPVPIVVTVLDPVLNPAYRILVPTFWYYICTSIFGNIKMNLKIWGHGFCPERCFHEKTCGEFQYITCVDLHLRGNDSS